MEFPRAADAQAADALRTAVDLGGEGESQVFLYASGADGGFEVRRLNLSQDVSHKFRSQAAAWAGSLVSQTLVPYAAGRKPSDHEVAYLSIEGVEPLAGLVASMQQPVETQLLEGNSTLVRRLRFYVVATRQANEGWVHFVRAKGQTLSLRRTRKLALVPSAGVYDELAADTLVFDATFDGLVAQNYALIVNQGNFERALGFIEQASTAALETLNTLLVAVAVSNADQLRAAAATDVNMIAKLRSIAAKIAASSTYAAAMTTDRLIEFAEEQQLEIDTEVEGGHRRFVFHPDPQRRWRILKLLDDDYLHSSLTELDYEVNSKSPLDR